MIDNFFPLSLSSFLLSLILYLRILSLSLQNILQLSFPSSTLSVGGVNHLPLF
ncbi:hypothetical protein BYT27DRAFT_6505254 [Phlegmacium glaucopus]|nr:hypothetical protein BYT27DRAFT_6505254 [Phlegmacium glaucopus]